MVKGAGMKLNHYKREKNKTKEFLENWELHTLNSLHQVYILKSYLVILTISTEKVDISEVIRWITKHPEDVLQWEKRKNIKKLTINGELVIEKEKREAIEADELRAEEKK